jgi:hypothetical protein
MVHHDTFTFEIPETFQSELWRKHNKGRTPKVNVGYSYERNEDGSYQIEVYYIGATVMQHRHIHWIPALYEAIDKAAQLNLLALLEKIRNLDTSNRLKSETTF